MASGSEVSNCSGRSNPIPVTRDRLETIVYRNILCGRRLKLLQHGSDIATRKNITGQQQHGQAIYGGGGRAGDHIGSAWSDGRGADERAHAETRFRKSGGRVDHGLFVAEEVVAQTRILFERLAEAGNVAVTEDSQASREEPVLLTVALGVLILQIGDGGLSRGETNRH